MKTTTHRYAKSTEAIPQETGFHCWNGQTGCHKIVPMARWNFPCLLCAECADRVAKAVGCLYEYAPLAMTCKRFDKWYRERYAEILAPLTERARVRAMMLMANGESLHEVTDHERKVADELADANGWGKRRVTVGTVPAAG